MREQLIALGSKIKVLRKARRLTLQALAEQIGLTAGLLSRVENSRTVPSLPVLMVLATALQVDLSELFEGIVCFHEKAKWLLIRSCNQQPVEREDSTGIKYSMILETALTAVNLQVMLVTIQPGAQREMVSGEGDEMLYLLSGRVEYRLGEDSVQMTAGDTLFFDGNLPHVPVNGFEEPAILLACYFLRENNFGNLLSEKKLLIFMVRHYQC